MKVTTKLKHVLKHYNCEIRMDDAANIEIYMHNKKDKTLCIVEGSQWGIVVEKAFRIMKKIIL